MIPSSRQILVIRALMTVVAVSIANPVGDGFLETYEDLSEDPGDLDVFGNLTFHFSCEDKPRGLYADPQYGCRIFHACDDSGKGVPVICPGYSLFDERKKICSDEDVDCEPWNEWFDFDQLSLAEVTDGNPENSEGEADDEVPSVLPLFLS